MKKIYFISLYIFSIALTAIFFSWGYRHISNYGDRLPTSIQSIILGAAEFPTLLKESFKTILGKSPFFVDNEKNNTEEWANKFPSKDDAGFLLLSGYDHKEGRSNIKLIKISDGSIAWTWKVDDQEIDYQMKISGRSNSISFARRLLNPLLLLDGSIVVIIDEMLFRINKKGKIIWSNSEHVHHSVAIDKEGNIWSPIVMKGFFKKNEFLEKHLQDNGIAMFSKESGKLLYKKSFSEIMFSNDMEGLLLGQFGFTFNPDPIHLNQITPALTSSKYWNEGDLLISARNLSTVFIYRPSTNKIVWHKTGPWFNQHSSLFVDSHRISILNNNVIGGVKPAYEFFEESTNKGLIYDFETNKITEPFQTAFRKSILKSSTEGRFHVINENKAFVEDSNNGRVLMLSNDQVTWQLVNYIDDKTTGILSWSSYLSRDEGEKIMKNIQVE